MELPVSEIEFWREYYSMFPFPQDREDSRIALLAQTISNMSGRSLKDSALRKIEDFLPDYLGTRKITIVEKSLEQQRLEKEEFKKKLKQFQKKGG